MKTDVSFAQPHPPCQRGGGTKDFGLLRGTGRLKSITPTISGPFRRSDLDTGAIYSLQDPSNLVHVLSGNNETGGRPVTPAVDSFTAYDIMNDGVL